MKKKLLLITGIFFTDFRFGVNAGGKRKDYIEPNILSQFLELKADFLKNYCAIREFRITFTANDRNDHVAMFTLHLPHVVFSFSVKVNCLC